MSGSGYVSLEERVSFSSALDHGSQHRTNIQTAATFLRILLHLFKCVMASDNLAIGSVFGLIFRIERLFLRSRKYGLCTWL